MYAIHYPSYSHALDAFASRCNALGIEHYSLDARSNSPMPGGYTLQHHTNLDNGMASIAMLDCVGHVILQAHYAVTER